MCWIEVSECPHILLKFMYVVVGYYILFEEWVIFGNI
jgi:hypothetical protein